MGKLVVLKLGEGSFEEGFPVTLQIGEEGQRPSLEIIGRLPPAPEIPDYYSGWATAYRRLGVRSRLEASGKSVINMSKTDSCSNAAHVLRGHLNTWLHSEGFRPIREKLLEQLVPSDEVRLIIQAENNWLRRLPWHLWDLCDRYPKLEIALSALVFESVEQPVVPHPKVRILAILGNSTGINTQADRLLLEQLPDAEINFLVEPQCEELTDELWKQGWDILFFAGHSSSQSNGETGRIYINQTDSLTIDQLKFALKKAVERGLKIAIFNSCDGLGLARKLADLKIPQTVVMREPVPDRVAQTFLKYFLEGFACGESFYLAVREARERLQGLENRFPCATWLPMIFQNPAVVPPSWQGLCGNPDNSPVVPPSWQGVRGNSDSPSVVLPTWQGLAENPILPPPVPPIVPAKPKPLKGKRGLATVVSLSLVVTFLLMGVRQLGVLQPMELQAFDHLMQRRPAEPPDERLLVVEVTQEDIEAQKQELRPGTSLSDRSLARLLEILESYQPRAIGLDIYRDFPVEAKYPDLAQRFKQSDRFITICKVSSPETNDPGIEPPPGVPQQRQGFSDVVTDPDGVLRRHVLAFTPSADSKCTTGYALSTRLAFRYLALEGILPKSTKDGNLQIGKTIFKRLRLRPGSYRNAELWGHQVMLNYRSYRSAENFARRITLSQVLKGKLNPDAVQDKIVLIGVTARSGQDYFFTPYSTDRKRDKDMPGVVAQAQMVSQIISAVLDGRPLLWVLPLWSEVLWVWGWALVGGLLFWRFRLWLRLGSVVVVLFVLYGVSLALLTQGGWVPLVPSALALVFTGGSVVAYAAFQIQRKQPTLGL